MKKVLSFVLGQLLLISIALSALAQSDTSTKVLRVRSLMQEMSLEQKIGQLFLVGFSGLTPEAGLFTTIRDIKPGGILFFSRNVKTARQTSQLIFCNLPKTFNHGYSSIHRNKPENNDG